MNEMRKLMEAVAILEYDDYDEKDFDQEDERYDLKDAEIEKFEGRKIFITDLYDGDVYGILDNKHGPRFMISAPLWRGEFPPTDVTEDEVEISSPTFDIDQNDADFLKRYYFADELNESVEVIGEDIEFRSTEAMIKDFVGQLRGISQDDDVRRARGGPTGRADYNQLAVSIKSLLDRIDNASVRTRR